MAAAVKNNKTVLDRLRQVIDDAAGSSQEWYSDEQLEEFIYRRFTSDKQDNYTFQLRAAGVWTQNLNSKHFHLFDMDFTGQDDATYTVNSTGSIRLTAGADASKALTVSGTQVNFNELVVDVLQDMYTQKVQKESVNVGAVSFTPQDEERLLRAMEVWRGMSSV